jgi:periplasmic divalent cation tolerance protein
MTEPLLQIVTTTASAEEARRIGTALVERRLAACVQIVGPVESVYRWQGKIETANEWQCQIKTRQSKYTAVEAAIRELHTYEVPEILAIPINDASPAYRQWLIDETQ